jgi:DNA-binding FadR family transcriptional regulator
MERVYTDLKSRIMAGAFQPGSRLDPVHLARELVASATPVRDALHRLSGERLVESWHQDGFHQLVHNESDLRDIYVWTQVLLGLALRAPGRPAPLDSPVCGADGPDYASRVARLFRAIALTSENRELRHAIGNVTDRSQMLRAAERRSDPDSEAQLAAMESDFAAANWSSLRRSVAVFHRRRIAGAGAVALLLRPPERQL